MAAWSYVGVGVLMAVTTVFPAIAAAHGNVALEDDICVQRVGGNLVHFNAYQPQHEAKAQYCTDIPGEGETFLVLDLIDPVLRTLPVGARVVRGSDGSQEDQTVAYWPPVVHPDGVLRGEAHLSKGLYTFVIMPEGFSSSSYLLRVQQTDYSKMSQKAVGPLVILLVVAMIGYELAKSRRWGIRRTAGR